jgi:hypothetical protein
MFYSLLALSLANKFESSKHKQLIGWFNKNFIYEGKIDERLGKIINKAFNRRTKGDYDTFRKHYRYFGIPYVAAEVSMSSSIPILLNENFGIAGFSLWLSWAIFFYQL